MAVSSDGVPTNSAVFLLTFSALKASTVLSTCLSMLVDGLATMEAVFVASFESNALRMGKRNSFGSNVVVEMDAMGVVAVVLVVAVVVLVVVVVVEIVLVSMLKLL